MSQAIDSYGTKCSQTTHFDHLSLSNGFFLIMSFAVFILANLYIKCYMNQENCQGFRAFFCNELPSFKTVTVGALTVVVLGFLWFSLWIMDENVSASLQVIAIYAALCPCIALILIVIKDREFTHPFLVGQLKRVLQILGLKSQSVVPENTNMGIMEINPHNVGPTLGSTRIYDDGGIYVGIKINQRNYFLLTLIKYFSI